MMKSEKCLRRVHDAKFVRFADKSVSAPLRPVVLTCLETSATLNHFFTAFGAASDGTFSKIVIFARP